MSITTVVHKSKSLRYGTVNTDIQLRVSYLERSTKPIRSIDTRLRNNKHGSVDPLTGGGATASFIERPRPIPASPRMNK